MVAYFTTPVRVLLLAAALAFAAQTADAARHTTEPVTTARTTARTKTDTTAQQEELPIDGLLIIVGVVGLVILLAWVCSRVGDSSSHVTD